MYASRSAWLLLPLVLTSLLLLAACNEEEGAPPRATVLQDSAALQKDTTFDASLAQILRRRQHFRVFSTLLDSAGFSSLLLRNGPFLRNGPYTVFAATSAGIEKMPQGLIDELLLPANRDRLRQIIAYHIHRGSLSKDSLKNVDSVSTLTGQALPVTVEGGHVLVGKERVSEYTITGSNGRIFAFDALVMPPVGGATETLPTAPTYDSLGSDSNTGQGATGNAGNRGSESSAGDGSSNSGSSNSGSSNSGSSNSGS